MAASESPETDWQLSKNSLKERNKHMFNNSLISDVSFSVKDSSADQQRSLLIPAHKYALAISSPVFFAMFYGQMPHTSRTVNLSDCDADSFMELLRFVYYDEAKLTGSNVIQVLYLAKKYMIPALSDECRRFLHENLDANNVFAVLPAAQTYQEAGLVEKCWNVVDKTSEEAMKSDVFLDVSHDLLKAVLERDTLNSREVAIFRAVDRWVEHQCEKMEREITGKEKRKLLGDAIYLIRFPVMTEKEFSSVASTTNLLQPTDICDIFYHFNNELSSPLNFPSAHRRGRGRGQKLRRIQRFDDHSAPDGSWYYNGEKSDSLAFSVNRDANIHGVRLYGCQGGQYTINVGVYHRKTEERLTDFNGRCKCEADNNDRGYDGFDVMFDQPAAVTKIDLYEIRAVISGPNSYYGSNFQLSVTDGGVTFSFSPAKSSPNGTSPKTGQFPEILFS